ncbi:MAG: VWA domain-containing protein [Pirellulaceae bacterium]
MMVFVAMLMVAFMVTIAFSIDLAHMHLTRAQLRSATDAAAKAAAQKLSSTQDTAAAKQEAKDIAKLNIVAGKPMTLDDADIQFGHSSEDPTTGKYSFNTSGTPINSVVVTGDRTKGSATGSVKLFFGGFFGAADFEPKLSATATYLERDIVLVVDRSGSMQGQKSRDLKSAIETFVTTLNGTPVLENVGLASYSNQGRSDVALTTDLSAITSAMNAMRFDGMTSISRGMIAGDQILSGGRNTDFVERTMIVMTDGMHNTPNNGRDPQNEATKLAAKGVFIHTITFGSGADQSRMREIATIGRGTFSHASTSAELIKIYREIALTLSTVITK